MVLRLLDNSLADAQRSGSSCKDDVPVGNVRMDQLSGSVPMTISEDPDAQRHARTRNGVQLGKTAS